MTVEQSIAEAVRLVVREEVRAALEPLKRAQEEEAVSMAEAARRLNLSSRTIQRRVKTGEIPTIVVGRTRRIRVSALMGAGTPR